MEQGDEPMQLLRRILAATMTTGFLMLAAGGPALAQAASQPEALGVPKPWEIGMQAAFGPLKEAEVDLHTKVLVIITLITLFVAGLLGWVMYRYSAHRNPVPTRTSHNTILEVCWTVIPVVILVLIAVPSFKLIYYQDRTPNSDLTVKVTGHQWYWEYSYPDQGNVDIESRYVTDEGLKPGDMRLLTVDNQLVIPVGKNVRLLTTSTDVIHSFFIPSLGVQRYAIPGRTIETWVRADQPGVFYGECNQICGENHSRMPIAVHAVPEAEFTAFIEQAKKAAQVTPANGGRMQTALADQVPQGVRE